MYGLHVLHMSVWLARFISCLLDSLSCLMELKRYRQTMLSSAISRQRRAPIPIQMEIGTKRSEVENRSESTEIAPLPTQPVNEFETFVLALYGFSVSDHMEWSNRRLKYVNCLAVWFWHSGFAMYVLVFVFATSSCCWKLWIFLRWLRSPSHIYIGTHSKQPRTGTHPGINIICQFSTPSTIWIIWCDSERCAAQVFNLFR